MVSARNQWCPGIPTVAALLTAVLAWPAAAQMPVGLNEAAEFPAETAAIVEATADLFDAIEAEAKPKRTRPVISGLTLATPASLTVEDSKAEVLTARGAVDHLTGYRINWYPVERFLGTVDFMGTWNGNRNLVCGYVTWDLSDPKRPLLENVTATFVEVAELSRDSDEAIHAALLDANCAYGAIEANYAFFE